MYNAGEASRLICVVLQITKLKIDSNPFAKGFRDSSRLTDFERWVSRIAYAKRNLQISDCLIRIMLQYF